MNVTVQNVTNLGWLGAFLDFNTSRISKQTYAFRNGWNGGCEPSNPPHKGLYFSASPTAGTVTITFGPSQTGCLWNIVEFGNVDTSGADGSGAVVQSATNAVDAATSLNVPLAALADAANATAGGFSNSTTRECALGGGWLYGIHWRSL
jgi:hypothetical protein